MRSELLRMGGGNNFNIGKQEVGERGGKIIERERVYD
jgi:hypothetical protein